MLHLACVTSPPRDHAIIPHSPQISFVAKTFGCEFRTNEIRANCIPNYSLKNHYLKLMKFLLLLIFALPFSSIVFSQGIDSAPALDDNLIESKQYKRLIEKHSKYVSYGWN